MANHRSRRSTSSFFAIAVRAVFLVLFSLVAACGGCDHNRGHGPSSTGDAGAEGGTETANPCAPPTIDPTRSARFADAVKFLYAGACPRQTGVDATAIDPLRVGVVRGRVVDSSGSPLAGVIVTWPRDARFGQTLTNADGTFDFVANGAAHVTLKFGLAGRLDVQRGVVLKPNRFAVLPDVALIAPSAKTNPISFAGNSWQVASGDASNDDSGARTAIILVAPNTTATVTKTDGSQAPLPKATLRITEHTTGVHGAAQMPGDLPGSSAYTYATNFAFDEVDQGSNVAFSSPAILYVDNFLHMPTGASVPSGAYDAKSDAWIPDESGVVVAAVGAGSTVGIDADGDGQADAPATLSSIGITADEIAAAAPALKPGQTYWRVRLAHFSSWDLNWGFGPPPDAAFGPDGSGEDDPSQPCTGSGASTYECENRTLAEDLDVVGTNATLHYQSDRVPGRTAASIVEIPVTGPTVPASAKGAIVSVSILGVTTTQTFTTLTPSQIYTFNWDGKDAYGRPWPGGAFADISVGLIYDGVYENTSSFGAWASQPGAITGDKTRKQLTLTTSYEARLGVWDQTGLGFGGWSLSIHHVYDPSAKILYRGDGLKRFADAIGASSALVAGAGTPGYSGDGGPAAEATFASPDGIAIGRDGSIYVADTLNHRIRRIVNGTVTTFAGNGTQDHTGDNGPALNASLNTPVAIAIRSDDSVCFSEKYADSVRCVGADGKIRPILGGGTTSPSATPIPALSAMVQRPTGLAFSPDGSLFVSEEATNHVLRISPAGTVEVAVGAGADPGENVLARTASLVLPAGLAVGSDGTLFIAESGANRVRRVDPSGNIVTLAGTGDAGLLGDGGLAASAQLTGPNAVAIGSDGSIYIADTGNDRIRRVQRGRIQSFAGGGARDLPGFFGPGITWKLPLGSLDSTFYNLS